MPRFGGALRRLAALSMAAAITVSCGSPTVGLVTRRNTDGPQLLAIVGGTLRVNAGCVVFDTLDGLAIPIWPAGTRTLRDRGTVVVADAAGRLAVREGEMAFFGGGIGVPLSWVREIADVPVPAACARDTVEYMIINSLERLPNP